MPATIRIEWVTVDPQTNIIDAVLGVEAETISAHIKYQTPASFQERRHSSRVVARIVSTSGAGIYFKVSDTTSANVSASTGVLFSDGDSMMAVLVEPGESLFVIPDDV